MLAAGAARDEPQVERVVLRIQASQDPQHAAAADFDLRFVGDAAGRDTSVSALCRELGINPVTLYRYVGPQGDLEARTSSPLHVSVG